MSYADVKNWRRRTKERAVASLGGKCTCCGYDRCTIALDFHHLDPKEKEFHLSRAITSWEKIVIELRKCVLVCCRCHREIHANLIVVPANAARFDENLAVYKAQPEMDTCPICGKEKYSMAKTCSASCANKSRSKIDWEKIDLLEMIKTLNTQEIGEQLNVSGAVVRKRLARLGYKSSLAGKIRRRWAVKPKS